VLVELEFGNRDPVDGAGPGIVAIVSGTAAEIVNNPVAREIYLGDRFAL